MPLPVAPQVAQVPVPDITSSSFWTAYNSNNISVVLGQMDTAGAMWVITDMQGWFMSPPVTATTQQLGFRDLSTATTKFPRSARPVTLIGTCFTQTFEDLFAARQRLMAAWGDPNTPFMLTVTEPDVSKQLTQCRLNGQIDASWMPGTPFGGWYQFNYSIPIIALDPVKYSLSAATGNSGPNVAGEFFLTFPNTTSRLGSAQPSLGFPFITRSQPAIKFTLSQSASGTVSVINTGNVESYPVIKITGLVDSGWYIQNQTTGFQFSVNLNVPSTSTLVIDMLNNIALIDGAVVNAQVQGSWFSCPPGNNNLQFFAPDNDGSQMYVSLFSAWR